MIQVELPQGAPVVASSDEVYAFVTALGETAKARLRDADHELARCRRLGLICDVGVALAGFGAIVAWPIGLVTWPGVGALVWLRRRRVRALGAALAAAAQAQRLFVAAVIAADRAAGRPGLPN